MKYQVLGIILLALVLMVLFAVTEEFTLPTQRQSTSQPTAPVSDNNSFKDLKIN